MEVHMPVQVEAEAVDEGAWAPTASARAPAGGVKDVIRQV
jgi:hypothetical protein